MFSRLLFAGIAAFSIAAVATSTAQAATVTLDFNSTVAAPLSLDPDSPGIVNGNCAAGQAPCLGVNKNGAAVLSIAAPLTFSVVDFWFQLLGKGDNLIVTTSKGSTTLLESLYAHNNGGQVFNVTTNSLFQDITFLSFRTNEGNARIDNLTVTYGTPAPVPLPAAGLMLAGALAGVASFRRRRSV